MKHYYRIGEIVELYGVGPDSLRYYEKLGILKPHRGENNYRMYHIHDLWRLNVIRDLRELGFSMAQIQEYLDEIRANLPGELRQAQAIVNDRSQIVDSANAQAKAIIRQAEERARVLVSESEIVKSAQQRASEIMAQAQAESRTLRQTTADYCDNMLKTTEETMVANASQVKNVRASLRQPPKKQQP